MDIAPWMLFAFPAVVAVPIIAGIALGGPILGFLTALFDAAVIILIALGVRPRSGWSRRHIARFALPLLIGAAGVVLITASDGTARIIGWGVVGVAVTVAMSLVFLAVGESEDRARRLR